MESFIIDFAFDKIYLHLLVLFVTYTKWTIPEEIQRLSKNYFKILFMIFYI